MKTLFKVALVLAAAASGGDAAVLVQSATSGPNSLSFPIRTTSSTRNDTDSTSIGFVFQQFDSALGTLNSVALGYTSAAAGQFVASILAVPSIASGVNSNMDVGYSLAPLGPTVPIQDSLFFNQSGTFTENPPVFTLNLVYPAQQFDTGFFLVPTATNSLYEGTGSLTVPLSIEFDQEATISSRSMQYQFGAATTSTVTLLYDYTPIPEPSTILLLGLSLTALLRRSRG